MKFLKQKIKNWLNSDDIQAYSLKSVQVDDSSNSIRDDSRSIQFRVYGASGGKVIETMRYDRVKDRHTTGLYIVTDDHSLGEEIEKIITMEYLK
jgi:hypothetical protein